jgi:nicotinamide-nucleotide amidase
MAAPDDAGLHGLVVRLARHLASTGRTLVAAESCTGGWIAKACTDLPGSSRWFLGGAVVYGNESKTALLDVDARDIGQHGAVSEPVVRAMALGALARLGGDLSVAVSGVAGPDGGTADKPVGTVWFAWAVRGAGSVPRVETQRRRFDGDREAVRRAAVQVALQGLLER